MIQYYVEGVNNFGADDGVDKKMGLYFTQCYDCALVVDTKCKAVVIDSCKKVKVQIADIVSAIEIVNSQSVTLYCKGAVPAISMDKCSSVNIVLCPECVKSGVPNIVSSCTTASNLEFWSEPENYESEQMTIPFPEQFNNDFDLKTQKITVSPVDHGD